MPFSINLAIITGNATRDPELRYTPTGSAVCSFGVATNHSIKRGDQWENVPTFHNIIVWGKQAEYISNTVKKGMKVSLTGRIDNRQYNAKDGTKKYISEIVADTVIPFTDRKTDSGEMPDITQGDEPSSLNQPVAEVGEKVEEKVEDIVIPDEMPF
ncbi:MAG: single-stranded DNA-binding protein [Patescibacteria group bacterium]